MDQATHNKSFNSHSRKLQPLRALAECPGLVSHDLLQGKLPAGRAFSSKPILVTVSQELLVGLGARCKGYAPTRMAWLVGWMPSMIGQLQASCAAHSRQILVTASRALTPHHGRGLSCAEGTRIGDECEVGLVAGQA